MHRRAAASVLVVQQRLHHGGIRSIGFSTHGMPLLIEKCIESDKFDYVNLHFHFFGDCAWARGKRAMERARRTQMIRQDAFAP